MAVRQSNPKARPRRNEPGRPPGGVNAPAYVPADPAGPFWVRAGTVMAVVAVGLVVRLLVSGVSVGTNDAATFLRFAIQVDDGGLLAAYRHDPDLNHPPGPVLWTWAAYRLTDGGAAFPFAFKLPLIAVEAVTAWVLWRRWRGFEPAAGRSLAPAAARSAALAAVGFALSPCAILVSGYHFNTDTVYASLCLLSVWLLESRGRPLTAGLALATAINVKLIPVLLIPGLLLSLRTRRDALRFLAGLAVGVLPFVPVLLTVGSSFYENALAYGSRPDKWGISFFLLPSADDVDPAGVPAAAAYHAYAKYPVLVLLVGWAVAARRLRRWDRYEVAAVTLALFLVLAPGFGVQYTVVLLPLMFAVRPPLANA